MFDSVEQFSRLFFITYIKSKLQLYLCDGTGTIANEERLDLIYEPIVFEPHLFLEKLSFHVYYYEQYMPQSTFNPYPNRRFGGIRYNVKVGRNIHIPSKLYSIDDLFDNENISRSQAVISYAHMDVAEEILNRIGSDSEFIVDFEELSSLYNSFRLSHLESESKKILTWMSTALPSALIERQIAFEDEAMHTHDYWDRSHKSLNRNRRSKDDKYREDYDFGATDDWCPACHEAPCMCSDQGG